MSEPRTEWTPKADYRPEPERQRRDSDAMLDRVSRSESETADIYRRIEEQLRGMFRRLDASERSQTESNRVMSKAAVEMNIAAREQAQAFDQLGTHVANITERLDRVESREPGDGLRDAVKALHQGLSRLADQISQTASQSASQIGSLANNLENVAGRVGQARHDASAATQALEGRLAAFDERVRTLEKAAQANAGTLDRALEAIEAQKKNVTSADVIARLEDSVRRLEDRGPDQTLDRRLGGIERALADVMARIEPKDEPDSIEQSLHKIVERLEALETANREVTTELRKAASGTAKPVEEPPPVTTSFGPLPAYEPPPFVEPSAAPPSFAAAAPSPFAPPPPFANAAPPPPYATAAAPSAFAAAAPPFAEPAALFEQVPEPAPAVPAAEDAAPTVESYLAAARRSARVAAQAEAQRSTAIGGLRWSGKPEAKPTKRTRPLVVGIAALIGIAVIAGAILSRQTVNDGVSPNVRALFDKPAVQTAKHAAPTEQPDTITVPETTPATQPAVQPPAAPTLKAGEPHAGLTPSGVAPTAPAPVPQKSVPAATPKPTPSVNVAKAPPPAPAQQQAIVRPAPLDRLTASANAGNARAQLIVALKYLDSVPANDGEAVKWLVRAAEAGEPVAQYRLGTLYERGRGVALDTAKAARWYQAAANQGSRKAMHNLAVAFTEGAGVKKDFAEASRWFLKAAALGLKDSQFNLAVLYERGLGVPQNLVDAYKWYAIAAAQGDQESKSRITAIASQLNNEERAAAQHAADMFRPGVLDARANVPPTISEVTRG